LIQREGAEQEISIHQEKKNEFCFLFRLLVKKKKDFFIYYFSFSWLFLLYSHPPVSILGRVVSSKGGKIFVSSLPFDIFFL
jgi:hypothetical protein